MSFRTPGVLSARELTALCGCLAASLMLCLLAASIRPLWFDEFSSLFMATAPWHSLQGAIAADGNPPLNFLLIRAALHIPVPTSIAIRLPSMFGTYLACVGAYIFVRRSLAPEYALLAALMPLACPAVLESALMEARPYGLLLCFTVWALCCWQSAVRSQSLWAVAGLALCMSGAILSHHYGIIHVAIPVLAGTVVRFHKTRRVDWKVLVAVALGALPALYTYSVMLAGQKPLLAAIRTNPEFWALPTWDGLASYTRLMPELFPCLTAALLGYVGWKRPASLPLKNWPPP